MKFYFVDNSCQRIISFGARNIVIPGNLPIGCMPIYLAMFGSGNSTIFDKNQCLKKYNRLANYYNDFLKKEIERLKRENPYLKIVYGDLFNAVEWLLPRAPFLGLCPQIIHTTRCFPSNTLLRDYYLNCLKALIKNRC